MTSSYSKLTSPWAKSQNSMVQSAPPRSNSSINILSKFKLPQSPIRRDASGKFPTFTEALHDWLCTLSIDDQVRSFIFIYCPTPLTLKTLMEKKGDSPWQKCEDKHTLSTAWEKGLFNMDKEAPIFDHDIFRWIYENEPIQAALQKVAPHSQDKWTKWNKLLKKFGINTVRDIPKDDESFELFLKKNRKDPELTTMLTTHLRKISNRS